ncbi:putative secreted protein (Por secretion system target) [Cellulophaga sp. RHA19]|uniref:T9SS type A sorting domain-containing protein n=2 Tax=Pseudomonadati TaxID=3379134 RepID=UPI000C2C3534|nr:T9SS type A sorting domain-containing protein [Cellulophaga sp. RHA19]PKB42272.1 putative secreted protein (Por secretion system target) [Cellulophaga sp. RHA19]
MKNLLKTKMMICIIILTSLQSVSAQDANQMNKQRRYDEISWLITHNANNNNTDGPQGFFGCLGGRNQGKGIKAQLQDGIRKFMVDIHNVHGELRLKHGSPNMCMMDAKDFNNIIEDWLKNHPLDIITLHVQAGRNLGISGMDDIFYGRRSGYKNMSNYIYNHSTYVSASRPANSGSDTYPTIQEMINSNKRLVIFSETNYNSNIYRYEFTNTVQNPYRAGQVSHLWDTNKFKVDRGIDHKTILTVNHFAGDAPTYNADKNKSREANKDVSKKAVTAWFQFGHRPSVAIDYYNLSNGRSTISQINEVNTFNEVRGRFIDSRNPNSHIKNVTTYLAEYVNGQWKKIKNIEYKGERAKWNLFYSFPARPNDNRALFFEHPNYTFSPSFIKIGDYDGTQSKTYTVNITASQKNTSRSFAANSTLNQLAVYPNPSSNGELTFSYNTDLPKNLTLDLYDLKGQLIKRVTNKTVIGKNELHWNFNSLKGIYILKGKLGEETITKKVVFK